MSTARVWMSSAALLPRSASEGCRRARTPYWRAGQPFNSSTRVPVRSIASPWRRTLRRSGRSRCRRIATRDRAPRQPARRETTVCNRASSSRSSEGLGAGGRRRQARGRPRGPSRRRARGEHRSTGCSALRIVRHSSKPSIRQHHIEDGGVEAAHAQQREARARPRRLNQLEAGARQIERSGGAEASSSSISSRRAAAQQSYRHLSGATAVPKPLSALGGSERAKVAWSFISAAPAMAAAAHELAQLGLLLGAQAVVESPGGMITAGLPPAARRSWRRAAAFAPARSKVGPPPGTRTCSRGLPPATQRLALFAAMHRRARPACLLRFVEVELAGHLVDDARLHGRILLAASPRQPAAVVRAVQAGGQSSNSSAGAEHADQVR